MGVVTPAAVPPSSRSYEPWRSALVLALFAALIAVVGARHEPWFDEAQAWLIGRDTTLWDLLAHRLRYEGSPGLWHTLLWLLSHAGVPFAYLWLVSGLLACIGAWIILTRAPFPYWLRVGIVFSYFVAYQYAIVARSYALDLVLIPLIAAYFSERTRRPVLYCTLLGLCANVNAYSFIIVGVLFVEFLVAVWRSASWQRAHLAGGALYLALAGAAVLQVWPLPPDGDYLATHERTLATGLIMIVEAFIDRFDLWSTSFPSVQSTVVGIALSVVLLVPSFILFRRAGILTLVSTVFAVLFVFSVVTFANAWHAGLVYLFWIFALWIGWQALGKLGTLDRRMAMGSIAVIVFVHVVYTATAAVRDIREPYSAGPAAAEILAQADARIAAVGFKTFAVQPWFPTNAFANYRDGAPDDAHYRWQAGGTFVRHAASFKGWRDLVNNRRYDALLLSNYWVPRSDLPRYIETARDAGYCDPTVLPGGLIWKSYVREDDGILVFKRCAGARAEFVEPK